ncbi:MAG: TetR family transcriptional regulator [Actinomycetota bacterium]
MMSGASEKRGETRMKGDDRRELILEAATAVFGDYGYVGTTTAVVAKAAGVSQPYVVRMFGTKQQLFIEVLRRALGILMAAFRAALATDNGETAGRRIGIAYVDLASQRGLLLSLMHGFVLGKDPVIGAVAREGFLCVYEFLRTEAGFDAEEAQQFLSGGMLINTLVGLRMTDDYDADARVRELMQAALPEKLDILLALRESSV